MRMWPTRSTEAEARGIAVHPLAYRVLGSQRTKENVLSTDIDQYRVEWSSSDWPALVVRHNRRGPSAQG